MRRARAAPRRTGSRPRRCPRGRAARRPLARIAELALYPVTQPQYVYRYGDELERALGDRAHRLTPLGEFASAGIPVVLSSDAPVTPPKPLEAIYAAVARRTLDGAVLGDGRQALDVHAALRGHTLGAAESIHRDRDVGSLEPGKLADFAVLSDDPTHVGVDELPQIRVRQTWIGGRRVATPAETPGATVRSVR